MTAISVRPVRTALARALPGLFAAAVAVSAAAAAEPVPNKPGDCTLTSVKRIESRLEGMPDSGSAIAYTDGLYQVSYEMDAGVSSSRPGDRVRICLVELPHDCPPGDTRGKIYKATNLRTHRSWTMPDSEHSCGGA